MDPKEKLEKMIEILKLYLARPSSDGKSIRQVYRKQLQELIDL